MAVACIMSTIFGPKKGALITFALLIIGSISAYSIFGETALYIVFYGGGFLLVSAGIGHAIGAAVHKKNQSK
jgi:hypothetical protein